MAARRRARRRTPWAGAVPRVAAGVVLAASIAGVSGLAAREAARRELRGYAAEQAALRRVAMLVARAAEPEEVFAAVVAEVGALLRVEQTLVNRYDADGGATTVLGAWAQPGVIVPLPVGTRWNLGGRNVSTLVMRTRRAARVEDYREAGGEAASLARRRGIGSSVGVPIIVEGELWGHLSVVSMQERSFPAGTEARLAGFTALVATALATAQARLELRGHAAEQAALRRVATLVARAAAPHEVFGAVCAEVGRLLPVDFTVMSRYHTDGTAEVLGAWARVGPVPTPVGTLLQVGGRNVTTLVAGTGRPARVDRYGQDAGPLATLAFAAGMRSAVGAPINVEGRLWGVIAAGSAGDEVLPADTEARLAGFTELVASAIANAESQAQLTASRARIVAAADSARRRIERDLHDGAQQRLVTLGMQLRAVQAAVPPGSEELHAQLTDLAHQASIAVDELRELARGIHPAVLAEGGLPPALRALARRSAVPVRLDLRGVGRLPEQVEIAAYYVVSEALTNAVKHAGASGVDVEVDLGDTLLSLRVSDDGRGGADLAGGTGLVGLKDRVEALGGRFSVRSLGAGTVVEADLPLDPLPRPG